MLDTMNGHGSVPSTAPNPLGMHSRGVIATLRLVEREMSTLEIPAKNSKHEEIVYGCEEFVHLCTAQATYCFENDVSDEAFQLLLQANSLIDHVVESIKHGKLYEMELWKTLHELRALVLSNLGFFFKRKAKLKEAIQYLIPAINIQYDLLHNSGDEVDHALPLKKTMRVRIGKSHLTICTILSAMGEHEKACENASNAAIRVFEALYGSKRGSKKEREYSPFVGSLEDFQDIIWMFALALHNFGVEKDYQRHSYEALEAYKKSYELCSISYGKLHPRTKKVFGSFYALLQKKRSDGDDVSFVTTPTSSVSSSASKAPEAYGVYLQASSQHQPKPPKKGGNRRNPSQRAALIAHGGPKNRKGLNSTPGGKKELDLEVHADVIDDSFSPPWATTQWEGFLDYVKYIGRQLASAAVTASTSNGRSITKSRVKHAGGASTCSSPRKTKSSFPLKSSTSVPVIPASPRNGTHVKLSTKTPQGTGSTEALPNLRSKLITLPSPDKSAYSPPTRLIRHTSKEFIESVVEKASEKVTAVISESKNSDQNKENEDAAICLQHHLKGNMARNSIRELREEKQEQEKAAVNIQKHFKGSIVRKEMKEKKEQEQAALNIQKRMRGANARKEMKEKQEQEQAALNIQKRMRGANARKEANERREQENAAVNIQKHIKGSKARKALKEKREENEAAVSLQKRFKGHITRKQLRNEKRDMEQTTAENVVSSSSEDFAAVQLQKHMKGHAARKKVKEMREQEQAAVNIQKHLRGHAGRKQLSSHSSSDQDNTSKEDQMEEDAAAVNIQKHMKGKIARKKFEEQKEQEMAARNIQKHVKGKISRKDAKEKEEAAVNIQRHMKGKLARKTMQQRINSSCSQVSETDSTAVEEETAAVNIQKHVKGKLARKHANEVKEQENAAVNIQKHLKGTLARKQVQQKREQEKAAVNIQKNVKARIARKEANERKEQTQAAINIQKRVKGHLARKKTNTDESDA